MQFMDKTQPEQIIQAQITLSIIDNLIEALNKDKEMTPNEKKRSFNFFKTLSSMIEVGETTKIGELSALLLNTAFVMIVSPNFGENAVKGYLNILNNHMEDSLTEMKGILSS